LREDRFKEEINQKTSKTEETLIKKNLKRMRNRSKFGGDEPQVIRASIKKYSETDDFGDLEDIWADSKEIISKKHDKYVN
jgi:hypothetical protein